MFYFVPLGGGGDFMLGELVGRSLFRVQAGEHPSLGVIAVALCVDYTVWSCGPRPEWAGEGFPDKVVCEPGLGGREAQRAQGEVTSRPDSRTRR